MLLPATASLYFVDSSLHIQLKSTVAICRVATYRNRISAKHARSAFKKPIPMQLMSGHASYQYGPHPLPVEVELIRLVPSGTVDATPHQTLKQA